MVLCVYGFPSHVNALQFEWAWQNPLKSLAVRGAAGKISSLKGVPGMIRLVCTMVTLPEWNGLNLSIQFMLSSLLQHRHGSPPLPSQMRLFVGSVVSLPRGDSQKSDDDDKDNLSTCGDTFSQGVHDNRESLGTFVDTFPEGAHDYKGSLSNGAGDAFSQDADGNNDEDILSTSTDTFSQDANANDGKDSLSTYAHTVSQDAKANDGKDSVCAGAGYFSQDDGNDHIGKRAETFSQEDLWVENNSMKMSPPPRHPAVIEITSSPEDDSSHGDNKALLRAKKIGDGAGERTGKDDKLRQESLTNVWPARKQAKAASCYYRNGRKVLKEFSNTSEVSKKIDTTKTYSGIEWNLLKSLNSEIQSDEITSDDELQEISASEFQQRNSVKRPLSNW